jgi:Zn-dependent alcohol dehydrogenase
MSAGARGRPAAGSYSLDGVNDGYDDMRNGRNLRGVITF